MGIQGYDWLASHLSNGRLDAESNFVAFLCLQSQSSSGLTIVLKTRRLVIARLTAVNGVTPYSVLSMIIIAAYIGHARPIIRGGY
jgi:hypothetical protein